MIIPKFQLPILGLEIGYLDSLVNLITRQTGRRLQDPSVGQGERLPNGFKGDFFFKSANQKQELPVVAMFVNGMGQHEQTL